jgi:DNA-binding CsgD family transcriptional regulator
MLQGGYLSVMQARNRTEFRDEVVRFAKGAGFEYVAATAVVDHVLGDSEFIGVDNTPQGYVDAFENVSNWQRDPVAQHCKRQSVPIIWDQATYTQIGQGERWEEQARFGYKTGIMVALHLPEGRHFILGVDRDQPLPKDSVALTRIVADVQLFSVHALDAAMRLLVPEKARPEAPALTPREVECLSRTMDGKTAWEVGNMLGISERTAVLHLQNAMRKLGCINKHQAVLKALRLGLIR